jgi:hypothetical protein
MAMSIPGIPAGVPSTELNELANTVHSVSLRLLRQIRVVDGTTGLSGHVISFIYVLLFEVQLRIVMLYSL